MPAPVRTTTRLASRSSEATRSSSPSFIGAGVYEPRRVARLRPMKKGRVVRPVLESELLKSNPLGDPANRETPVYLPPSYDDEPNRRYPMILAITGFTG